MKLRGNDNRCNSENLEESSSDTNHEESELEETFSDVANDNEADSTDEERTLQGNHIDVTIDECSDATSEAGVGSCELHPHFDDQEGGPGSSDNIKEEIVSCILRGLILAEEMTSSVTDMEKLLKYAKDLYCKVDCNLEKYWPCNWRETEILLKEVGYEDPKE